MRHILLLSMTLAFSACGTSEQPTAPVASVDVPPEWQFVLSEGVTKVIGADERSFIAEVDGDVASSLEPAVAVATSAGWQEYSRSDNPGGGQIVHFRR